MFEQTDYSGYAPINKKPVDLNNAQHSRPSPTKTGRKTNDEFKQGIRVYEPVKNDYDPKARKNQMLGSALDKPVEAVP